MDGGIRGTCSQVPLCNGLFFQISLGALIANCRETRPLDPAQQDPVAWPAGACIFLLCALVRPGGGWVDWMVAATTEGRVSVV